MMILFKRDAQDTHRVNDGASVLPQPLVRCDAEIEVNHSGHAQDRSTAGSNSLEANAAAWLGKGRPVLWC